MTFVRNSTNPFGTRGAIKGGLARLLELNRVLAAKEADEAPKKKGAGKPDESGMLFNLDEPRKTRG